MNVYEVLRASSACWSCGMVRHAAWCAVRGPFDRGEAVSYGAAELPRVVRDRGWDTAVTVYPDGRIEEGASHDVHGLLGSGCPPTNR